MNLVLLGPPGSGKGTQAKKLAEKLNLIHLSTGDILREEIKDKTELGKKAKSFMEKGELVSDDIILEVIRQRIKGNKNQKGFVLDGFPRTILQAEGLDKLLSSLNQRIDQVILLSVSDEEIIRRISGRLVCPNCAADFNIYTKPPLVSSVCNICQTALVKREDDTKEVVLNRLKVYQEKSEPIEKYYKKQKKLKEVSAEKEPEKVFALILSLVQ